MRLKNPPKGPKGSYKPHSSAEWKAFKAANPGVGVKEFVKIRKADPANYYNYGGMAMPTPRYQIQGAPNLLQQQGQGPLGALTDFAKSKALSAGLEAAFPGGGLVKEGAEAVLPSFFNQGGRAPLGGGQSKEGLMQARQMGALTQEEFLKAMQHAGYLNEGGQVPWWKKVWKNDALKSDSGDKYRVEHLKNKKKQPPVSKGDVGSVIGSLLSAGFFKNGGQVMPAYQRMGGMTPGPLGMSDMLAAGKDKDISKVVYKKKGGDIEDTVEIGYHAPLAAKPSAGA